jgi:hypothetical protein
VHNHALIQLNRFLKNFLLLPKSTICDCLTTLRRWWSGPRSVRVRKILAVSPELNRQLQPRRWFRSNPVSKSDMSVIAKILQEDCRDVNNPLQQQTSWWRCEWSFYESVPWVGEARSSCHDIVDSIFEDTCFETERDWRDGLCLSGRGNQNRLKQSSFTNEGGVGQRVESMNGFQHCSFVTIPWLSSISVFELPILQVGSFQWDNQMDSFTYSCKSASAMSTCKKLSSIIEQYSILVSQ